MSITIIILIFFLSIFFLLGLMAPIESIRWWKNIDEITLEEENDKNKNQSTKSHKAFVVFFSGVEDFSRDSLNEREKLFLKVLSQKFKTIEFVSDIFPYSPQNKNLKSDFLSGWFWKYTEYLISKKKKSFLLFILRFRNIFRVAVSADSRYGPIFNFGIAKEIANDLISKGYILSKPSPIILIGSSGGAQIALGASLYLPKFLKTDVTLISIGGVMSDDPGLETIKALYSIEGTKDSVSKIGKVLYPNQLNFINPDSRWNAGIEQGKIKKIICGPMHHSGIKGYLDDSTNISENVSYLDHTINIVEEIINKEVFNKTDGIFSN
jgi:hypothetical protein